MYERRIYTYIHTYTSKHTNMYIYIYEYSYPFLTNHLENIKDRLFFHSNNHIIKICHPEHQLAKPSLAVFVSLL